MAKKSPENWKILKSSGGITLVKMYQSHWNVNWNSLLQSNKPSFSAIATKMAKKSLENWKILKILSSGGITLAKMYQLHWNAKWNCNSILQSVSAIATKMEKKKSGKLNSSTFRGHNSYKN
jgi:hypothetical protein